MVEVKLENVTKKFGDLKAVDHMNIKVQKGEILTLLGPSGCGKSTTLRTIAGFYYPDTGRVYFGDRDVTDLPPQKRNTAMVFQNYALWPHMSVRDNVAYGLKLKNVTKREQDERVKHALKLVDMEEYIDRMPNKLSGGQQQRVAVARCLVVNPDVLLMDEPLSNLDAKLRIETRREIRELVKELDLTAVYVTHDQEEALSISDYIVVMDRGKVRQTGKPKEIWEEPANSFVADFIGEANLLKWNVKAVNNGKAELELPKTDMTLKTEYCRKVKAGETAKVILRPEKLEINLKRDISKNQIPVQIHSLMYLGIFERITTRLSDGNPIIVYRSDWSEPLEEGQKIFINVNPRNVLSFGKEAY